mgnify:CR=1 FL=1
MKKHNFSAGPCILPQDVFQQASNAILNFNNLDLSLLEISHRSPDFMEVMDKAQSLVKELMGLPSGYSVLFLQGGASMQFLMTPYNLMKEGGKAAYLNTGAWANKAIVEAERFGTVDIVASSKDKNFNYIPKGYDCSKEYDYFHCTSNNTIFGTQIQNFELMENAFNVCDMSSDIFSRVIDYSKFDLIYAGAQKNIGPAGVTLVVVNDEILGKTGRDIPSMLNYALASSKGSMFNTPPVFSTYVSMLTLEWLKNNGGIAGIEKINEAKAHLLYSEIDRNPLFKAMVNGVDRSKMNATFVLINPEDQNRFDKLWKEAGVNGLGGHRSVGGYRASMYNALPFDGVQVLVDVMKELEKKA